MNELNELLADLRLQLNCVCYDNDIREKLQGVWEKYFEIEDLVKNLTIPDVVVPKGTLVCECPPMESNFSFDGLPCDFCTNCGRKAN